MRLALVLNAYMAKPYATHPKEEFFDAVRHKKRLRALRHQTSSAAQPAPDGAAVARWRGKLRELSLDVSPVAAEQVFRHRPSKTISSQPEQKQVLEKFGVYKTLKLWQDQEDWGRFFMFNKGFVDFNRRGMQAEDPNAHELRESKAWINYTEHVGSDDWANALSDRHLSEVALVEAQLRAGVPRSDFCLSLASIACCPRNAIWDWYVETHGHPEASAALNEARARLTGDELQQIRQINRVQCEMMNMSGNPHHNITYSDVCTTMYTQYKLDCVSPEPTSSSCGPLERMHDGKQISPTSSPFRRGLKLICCRQASKRLDSDVAAILNKS